MKLLLQRRLPSKCPLLSFCVALPHIFPSPPNDFSFLTFTLYSSKALEQKTPEQVAAEVAKAKADNDKKLADEEAARVRKEKEERAARKAAINARFGGGGSPMSPTK